MNYHIKAYFDLKFQSFKSLELYLADFKEQLEGDFDAENVVIEVETLDARKDSLKELTAYDQEIGI